MARPTDQMIATEKIIYYSHFPRREGLLPHGAQGEAPRSEKTGKNCGQEHLLWFPQKGASKVG